MSTDTQEMEMRTRPEPEHEWLQQLVGDWTVTSKMWMDPESDPVVSTGREHVTSFGGLFAYIEGQSGMPDGDSMNYKIAIGYDVSFKQYRAVWFADVSSHIWKYEGSLSADGKTMTMDCVGPNMMREGETSNYRDVTVIVDANHRTQTSYFQTDDGEWVRMMHAEMTRV